MQSGEYLFIYVNHFIL